jgi:DNA-binding transcriptional ArsR family regulator
MVTNRQHTEKAVFKAIADPTRREILHLLRGGGQSVGSIAANFESSRPAMSRHLRLLRSAGLV